VQNIGVVKNVRTTKKTSGVMNLEVNQSNMDVQYSKMLWEGTMEDLQDIREVNPPQFGRFLRRDTSLFCCGGGFEGVINFDLSKRGKKEGFSRF